MSRIKISKAKLTKNGCLEVNYLNDDGDDITLKGCNPVHPDLKSSLRALVPYLADITEQKEAKNIDWGNPASEENINVLNRLDVTGCTVSGDTYQVCTLIGKRTLQTNKVLNICCPSTGFDCENEQYERCEDFRDAVMAFLYEAEQYVINKKWAVVQQEFDFENAEDPFAEGGTPTDDVDTQSEEMEDTAA